MLKMTELHSFGDWEFIRVLGSGGFGEVFHWKNRVTNQEIATKRLKKNVQMGDDEIVKMKERWQQEHKWMLDMQTDYIVRGVNLNDPDFVSYLNDNHVWPTLPVIVMEYCNGGDVRMQLQKMENMNGLTEYETRQILQALRYAVEYLHNVCGIEHRDLKPDNIIMHNNGRQRCYKLTDFGFARNISDRTILKSCVGTRHYVAPEVVDTAKYTNSVDYWSMGIIAFELICGILPFLPHQGLFEIIVNIKKKASDCIAITENIDTKEFVSHTTLFAENQVSSVFQEKIEDWLRIALDVNYKTRGTMPNATDEVLKFYSILDEISQLKILTVFCLTTYKFYSYEISADMQMHNLMAKMENDMGIMHNNLFLFLPTCHPNTNLPSQSKPIELFVEKWQDTSDPLNPPAMMFAVDYQSGINQGDPYVSDVIKKCLGIVNGIPKWLLEQFEQHTHFVLSNEQRLLEGFITGLKEYALTVDDAICSFSNSGTLESLQASIIGTIGRVNQLHTMVLSAKNVSGDALNPVIESWIRRVNGLSSELHEMDAKIAQHIKKRYESVVRIAKEEATKKILDEFIKADIYEVKHFRRYLKKAREQSMRVETRIKECQKVLYNFTTQRTKFFSNNQILMSRENITYAHKEFLKISNIVQGAFKFLEKFNRTINCETDKFFKDLFENRGSHNSGKPYHLTIDGASIQEHSLIESTLKLSTQELVEDTMDTIKNMNRVLAATDGEESTLPFTI